MEISHLNVKDLRKSNPEMTPKELIKSSANTTMDNTFAEEHIVVNGSSSSKTSRLSEDKKSEDSKLKGNIEYPENIHHRPKDINLDGIELKDFPNPQEKDSACFKEGGNVQTTSKAACKEFVKAGGNMDLNLIGSPDLSKPELNRRSRKDTNEEEKKTKMGDPKEQGDEKKEFYTSSDVWLLKEPEDEGEDYVNIKEPTDRDTDELHPSICCYTNCADSEFEKHSGKEPAEFTAVKDTFNNKKYTMSYDPKTHRDSRGEIHDEDLRPGNYDEIKIRLAKYKQTRIQEPLSAIDFGTSDSKRKEEHTLIGSLQRMDLLMDEAKLFERWTPAETVPEHFEFEVEKDRFELFAGKNSVFSMWYPCTFIVDGKTYNCVEQYMVHRKAGKMFLAVVFSYMTIKILKKGICVYIGLCACFEHVYIKYVHMVIF